ncbi:MAG: pilus assembly protein N-terminal domain-containing protein [Planctomycetia bacterium]
MSYAMKHQREFVACLAFCLLTGLPVSVAFSQQTIGSPSDSPNAEYSDPATELIPELPQPPGDLVESVYGTDGAMEVVLGQGRLLSLNQRLATEERDGAIIAVGDPSIVDFEVIGLTRIRLTGLRIGTTDLSLTTADGLSRSIEIHVVADLRTLRARLAAIFPDSSVTVTQIADHIILQGQARTAAQAATIHQMTEAWLKSVQSAQTHGVSSGDRGSIASQNNAVPTGGDAASNADSVRTMEPDLQVSGGSVEGQIVNLLTVPGSQQIMLKVQIAELNRTALRRLGASFLFTDGQAVFGASTGGSIPGSPFLGSASSKVGGVIVDGGGSLAYMIDAMRKNSVLKILAEPTLVSYSGHEATFLAGGEFPVPVPQGGGSGINTVTVQWKEFGVKLGFLPNILDGDRIRLTVTPEFSTIDRSLGTVLVVGGTPVPGLNTRRSTTTMEMMPGQTLAMAGLLQLTMNNETQRIPGFGDLPVLGPFFSNNSGERTEKELIVMVTPYMVEPVEECETGLLPGEEIQEPNDLEFFLLGRIEGRTGADFRSTTNWDDPENLVGKMKLHRKYLSGPSGYSR